jgi:transposase
MQGRKHRIGAVSKYSLEYRRQVALDYESGDLSYLQVSEKYGLSGRGLVRDWVRGFRRNGELVPSTPEVMTEKEKEEQDALRKRIKELEKQLEDERLRSLGLSIMIDVVEEDLGVPVRKKPGSRQSKG